MFAQNSHIRLNFTAIFAKMLFFPKTTALLSPHCFLENSSYCYVILEHSKCSMSIQGLDFKLQGPKCHKMSKQIDITIYQIYGFLWNIQSCHTITSMLTPIILITNYSHICLQQMSYHPAQYLWKQTFPLINQ